MDHLLVALKAIQPQNSIKGNAISTLHTTLITILQIMDHSQNFVISSLSQRMSTYIIVDLLDVQIFRQY